MSEVGDLTRRHFDALLAEAVEKGIDADLVGRTLLQRIIDLWRATRSPEDIASELQFAADHVDGDDDFTFMRP